MSKETSVKISYGMFISCIVIVLHHSVGDVFYGVGISGVLLVFYFGTVWIILNTLKFMDGWRFIFLSIPFMKPHS